MDSNHTIHLKPMYPHSLISLYNAPVISATMPSLALTSTGLNMISTTTSNDNNLINGNQETSIHHNNNNNNNSNNQQQQHVNINDDFNALAMIQSASSASDSAHLVPSVTTNSNQIANNICLNRIQLQQVQMQHQQPPPQSQSSTHYNHLSQNQCNIIGQPPLAGHMLQIQISAPSLEHNIRTANGTLDGLGATSSLHIQSTKSNNNPIPDTSSNLSSSSSSSSTPSEVNGHDDNSPENLLKVSIKRENNSTTRTGYVNLSKANSGGVSSNSSSSSSSSNNSNNSNSSTGSAISIKLNLSDSGYSSSKADDGKGFKCQICNRDFTQKGNLKTHLMTHSGERPYECQSCGKNFTQKGNLDTHVKIHTETKDHRCQYCDRGFTQRGNLKTHIRSIHTKEKPYACGHCGKAFSQKGNMLTHYRTHDKEARFPCNICGKTFSQKGNLKTHQQRHGRGSGR